MHPLNETEIRALNQGTPDFTDGSTFARNTTPEEIRRLIAETRAKFMGAHNVAECRRQYERNNKIVVQPTENLASISVF
jgi:hypothetical protein